MPWQASAAFVVNICCTLWGWHLAHCTTLTMRFTEQSGVWFKCFSGTWLKQKAHLETETRSHVGLQFKNADRTMPCQSLASAMLSFPSGLLSSWSSWCAGHQSFVCLGPGWSRSFVTCSHCAKDEVPYSDRQRPAKGLKDSLDLFTLCLNLRWFACGKQECT